MYSEPASNMAKKSIGVRINTMSMQRSASAAGAIVLSPEVMIGLSKYLMVHAETWVSNRQNRFGYNGASLYGKYRFYSEDGIHNHFRLAASAMVATNNLKIVQPAIDLYGNNSGLDFGIVATKLVNRIAVSGGANFLHATDNTSNHAFKIDGTGRNALRYNLSFGALIFPKEYVSYDQTNMNVMLEMPGQINLKSGKQFVDLAPSIQFIIRSKMRLDAGYRFAALKDLYRRNENSFLLRFEYNFFNAF